MHRLMMSDQDFRKIVELVDYNLMTAPIVRQIEQILSAIDQEKRIVRDKSENIDRALMLTGYILACKTSGRL